MNCALTQYRKIRTSPNISKKVFEGYMKGWGLALQHVSLLSLVCLGLSYFLRENSCLALISPKLGITPFPLFPKALPIWNHMK